MAVAIEMHAGGGGQQDILQGLLAYPSILIKQKPRGAMLEYFCGCETENQYKAYNPEQKDLGEILILDEHSECLQRTLCSNLRTFEISVKTTTGLEVCRFDRPFRGRQGGLFCCFWELCFQTVKVYAGSASLNPGAQLGYVREDYSFCVPVLSVHDVDGNERYRIIGNCCGCMNYSLHVYVAGDYDNAVGKIQKKWSGLGKELFTDADNFFITFPAEATAQDRALLIGALMLIDFLFFENNQSN